jgi:hypothetical protein
VSDTGVLLEFVGAGIEAGFNDLGDALDNPYASTAVKAVGNVIGVPLELAGGLVDAVGHLATDVVDEVGNGIDSAIDEIGSWF